MKSYPRSLKVIVVLLTIAMTAAYLPAQDKAERFVSIDFNDVEIGVFIKFISELTGKNFIIDQRVKGKVSIISPAKISVDEAYKVFLSVLEVQGFAAVESGEMIKLVPAPEVRSKNIETIESLLRKEAQSPDDKVVTQLIPLRYADPNEIKQLLAPLISKNSVVLSYQPTNLLILTDVYSNVQRLVKILKTIDVPGVGQVISVIPIQFADAEKIVKVLTAIFQQQPQQPQQQKKTGVIAAKFVADERTNSIILLSSENDTDKIKELILRLDKEMPKGKEKIRVYYLENATAEDLAKVLKDIPSKQAGAAPPQGGKKEAPVLSDSVKIAADKATNSLIITADKEDYAVIEEIIKKLDIPRAMVYIESLIMEVNVDKDFKLGAEWIVGGKTNVDGRPSVVGTGFAGGASGGDDGYSMVENASKTASATPTMPLPSGLSMGIFGQAINIGSLVFPNLGAVIQAYKKDKDAHILSTPQILTTDNQEAKITVGRNIPFQTRSGVNSSTNSLTPTTTTGSYDYGNYNSFEYKDIGKMLKITPQISKDRMVRLNISLEVTDLESTTDFRPTTLKRAVETTVVIKDGDTVVIGGLIDDRFSSTEYKVPCVGDIPGLGWLFSSIGKGNTKTNLFVFLTPRVLKGQEEVQKLYQKKRDEIDKADESSIKLYKKGNEDAAEPKDPESLD